MDVQHGGIGTRDDGRNLLRARDYGRLPWPREAVSLVSAEREALDDEIASRCTHGHDLRPTTSRVHFRAVRANARTHVALALAARLVETSQPLGNGDRRRRLYDRLRWQSERWIVSAWSLRRIGIHRDDASETTSTETFEASLARHAQSVAHPPALPNMKVPEPIQSTGSFIATRS